MENQFSAVAKVILNLRDLNCHLFSFKSDVQQLFQYHSRASSNELGGHVAEEQTASMGAFAAPAAQTLPTRGEEGDQENFAMTAADNAMTLVSLFGSFSDPSDFLSHEDVRITAHPTRVDSTERDTILEYKLDIDGVVIELNSFSAVNMCLYYITFPTPNKMTLKGMFHQLKKHYSPGHYSPAQFKLFKRSKGIILAHQQGWQLSVALVPDDHPLWHPDQIEDLTLNYFTHLHQSICALLSAVPKEDLSRPTLKKNRLYDLSRFNILPQDQDFLLQLIDRAVSSVSPHQGLIPLIFMCKFGQKQTSPLALGDMCSVPKVKAISVHSACDVLSKNADVSLFWSKYALHKLAGSHGTMSSVLTLREAVNFQSNLDGKRLTVDRKLLSVSKFPGEVTFIQLYTDTPHNRMEQYRPHPVSGEIACCGLLHHQTNRAMSRCSDAYLRHMQELVLKLHVVPNARVEIVTLLRPGKCGQQISAEDLINVDALKNLLTSQPMLIPFSETVPEGSFLSAIRKVANHLIGTLATARAKAREQGKFVESWTAFQAEIGLEVLFWGHPMSPDDHLHAINLGVATENHRSLTWHRGFLGLEPANSSALENEPPPLSTWTKKDKQTDRIHRLFGFADSLDASYSMLGKKLIQIIVRDLYRSNTVDLPVLSQSSPPTGKCIGIISVEHLTLMLAESRHFVYPDTFQKAASMMAGKGLPLKEVLQAGLRASEIKYFPAWQSMDKDQQERQKHCKNRWNRKHFWNIAVPDQAPPLEALADILSNDVLATLKNSNLTYDRNLVPFQEHGMPWMLPVLRRIVGAEKRPREELTKVCTFLSCVAFIQQGIYVDYRKLSRLELELPINQARLRSMQIQDSHLVHNFNVFKLYKVHPDIPFKIIAIPQKKALLQPRRQTANVPSDEEEEEEEEEHPEEPEEEVQNSVACTAPMVVPAGLKRTWTARELSFVEVAFHKAPHSILESYSVYQKVSLEGQIPVRTFYAYKKKFLSMKKAIS